MVVRYGKKAQGTRNKAQERRHKAQGTRHKKQGTRNKKKIQGKQLKQKINE
jgi:hypothetical protein